MAKKSKQSKLKSYEAAIDEILNDEKQTNLLVEYFIEVNQREENLKTSQRELKETFEAIKKSFSVTKADVKKILEYAKSLFSEENMDDSEKRKIELMQKLSQRLVDIADKNSSLKRVLITE